MRLILATKDKEFAEVMKHRFDVIATFGKRTELLENIHRLINNDDDILFVTEGFECEGESIDKILKDIKRTYPDLRIIYIKGQEYTNRTKNILQNLIEAGIWDIAIAEEMTLNDIVHLIENPKSYDEVNRLLDTSRFTGVYKRMFLFSSLKPGTGKTFMATNVAIAIAKYGQKARQKDGQMVPPRVLLVDGDLANLAVSTLLRVEDYDRNMLHALQKIRSYFSADGELLLNEGEVSLAKDKVKGFLTRYHPCPNLYVMSASNIPGSELEKITPEHFYFMMQQIVPAFHIIIADSNSAFDHQTTAGLYDMSGRIYLLMDNDYNNIQNTLRYYKQIKELGYGDKVEFIVNKDISRESELTCLEDLEFSTNKLGEIDISYRIPLIDAGIVKTIDYGGTLVVLSDLAPEAKKQILEVADSIWKIDYSKVNEEEQALKQETKKENKILGFLNK